MAEKGGEIDPRWGSGVMPERDINPHEAGRNAIREHQARRRRTIEDVIKEGKAQLSKSVELKVDPSTKRRPFGPRMKMPPNFDR